MYIVTVTEDVDGQGPGNWSTESLEIFV